MSIALAQAGWFKQQTLVKVPVDVVSGEGRRPGLQMAAISLCPHMVESRKREQALAGLF